MDFQSMMNFILPTTCAVLGWFCRELWTAVQELKVDLAKLGLTVNEIKALIG